MNERQVKLLRYFAKSTGDLALAGAAKAHWDTLDHRKKGKLTAWMKKVIVTMMAVTAEKKKAKLEGNKKTLENFFPSAIVDANGKPLKV